MSYNRECLYIGRGPIVFRCNSEEKARVFCSRVGRDGIRWEDQTAVTDCKWDAIEGAVGAISEVYYALVKRGDGKGMSMSIMGYGKRNGRWHKEYLASEDCCVNTFELEETWE